MLAHAFATTIALVKSILKINPHSNNINNNNLVVVKIVNQRFTRATLI
jgi:hypothetical protein